jgi:hypothetical protein
LVYEGVWTFGEETQSVTKTFIDESALGEQAEVRITFLGPDNTPQVEGGAPYRIYFADSSTAPPAATRTDLRILLEEVRGIIAEIGNAARPSA